MDDTPPTDGLADATPPVDPRIPAWVAADRESREAAHQKTISALAAAADEAQAAVCDQIVEGAPASSDEWLTALRTAISTCEALRAAAARVPEVTDPGLEALRLASPGLPLCAPRSWLRKHMPATSRLVQLVQEGVYTATVHDVRFLCRARMGGYKYQDIKAVKDLDDDLGFDPKIRWDGHEVDDPFEAFRDFGDFDAARRKATVAAGDWPGRVFDQGEEWDTHSHASTWGRFSVVVFCPAGRTIEGAGESIYPDPAGDDVDEDFQWWM